MLSNKVIRPFAALLLAFSFIVTTLPLAAHAQVGATAAAPARSYEKALSEIETKLEERRKALGIPGMSLVIVHEDKVIYMKGLGYKDFENKIAVTPDTQFAIGSSSKAFTGLSVLISQDEGKLSLDDSPKKYLPYFKMYDAETDQKITIRDLLSHSSGLNRTDLAMLTGKLTRAELVQVAAQAKPTAKLREKFQYQNIMFAAAGEIVSQVQKQPWEKWVPEHIFKPLGMTNSNMSIHEMKKAKDVSLGYQYNFDTKETKLLPYRDIDQVAPAGSINSSARDMAQWLRFILGGGVVDGKRLVSEKGFEEWLKPQMKMNASGTSNYGLGWMLQKWDGHTVVQHGGNIDGFNALVATIPEKKLGFVMLTNVSGSSLGGELMPIVWSNILGKPATAKTDATAGGLEKEVGKYKFEAAGFDVEVQLKDGKLVAIVPNQPVYTLENVDGRRYKLGGAPEGFFITFKDTELFIEQPQGNYTLPRIKSDAAGAAKPAADPNALKELIGRYEFTENNLAADVKEIDGKVSFAVAGQAPYPMVEKAKDSYSFTGLPDGFTVRVKRDAAGKVIALVTDQPGASIEWKRLAGDSKVTITVDELQTKVIEASGGEAAWRKLTSRVVETDIDLEHQGVKAKAVSYAKAPNKTATETTMFAIGKRIATGWEYFDGTAGEQAYSFSPSEKYSGKLLEDARLAADFYGMLDWKSKYKKIEITGTGKVGDEDAYIVSFEPEKGTAFKEFYSTKTFLLLKREGVIPVSTSSQSLPYTVTYSDYRDVDGVKYPFRTVNNSISNGNVVNVIRSVKHNVAIEDKVFATRKLQ